MNIYGIVAGGSVGKGEINLMLRRFKKIKWIAADSGAESLLKAGIYPNILVGDLDSIHQEALRKIKSKGRTLIYRFPPEKDYSDTYLAFEIVRRLSRGKDAKVIVLGAIGNRIDHSLTNLRISFDFLKAMQIVFYNHNHCIIPCQAPVKRYLSGRLEFPFVSLYPISETINGLTFQGVRYPLREYFVDSQNASLLLSNQIIHKRALLKAEEGKFLIIRSRD